MTHLIPDSWRQACAHLRDEIHQALDRWWYGHGRETEAPRTLEVVSQPGRPWTPATSWSGSPALDVAETDDAIIVTADLPGFEQRDYTVELWGQRLCIRGEKKQASERCGNGYYYAERSHGAFARILPLPCEVDAEHTQATYRNGVLRVTLPKTARARARRVNIPVHG